MIHPVVRDLFLDLGRHPAFQDVLRRLSAARQRVSLSGLTTTAKALYVVLLWQSTGRPLIVVVDGNKQAEALSEAVDTLLRPAGVGRPRAARNSCPRWTCCRCRTSRRTRKSASSGPSGCGGWPPAGSPITVMPVASALLRIEPGDFYRQLALRLRVGDEVPLEEVVAHLESIGYERREPVEMVGEYSVRGGILDVFSPEVAEAGAHRPVRRPGGVHPALRCGVAALGPEGGRLPCCCR